MSFTPKSKLLELSGIPWATRKIKVRKPKVPWAAPKEKPILTTNTPNYNKLANLRKGQEAEAIALQWLEAKGLRLVTSNHRCRCGELDLIMTLDDMAVVVEVRLRNNLRHASALESISTHKQRRVTHCAKLWWAQFGQYHFTHLRFDVVALQDGSEPVWVQNAWLIND